MADSPELGAPSRERIAALVGVAPINGTAGEVGSPDDRLRAFAERLEAAGKAWKVMRIAVARKLLVIANAILRTSRPWSAEIA